MTPSWAFPQTAGSGTQNERYLGTLFTELLPEAAEVVMQVLDFSAYDKVVDDELIRAPSMRW